MAVITGKDGNVAIQTDASGENPGVTWENVLQITSWSISIEADTLEFTSFDSGGWKENKGSLLSWSGSIEGFADSSSANPLNDIVAGETIWVQLDEGGAGSGRYYGKAVVTSKNVSSSTAELVSVSLDVTGTGELDMDGTVPTPPAP